MSEHRRQEPIWTSPASRPSAPRSGGGAKRRALTSVSTRARCWLADAAGDHNILRSTRVQFLSVPRARQQRAKVRRKPVGVGVDDGGAGRQIDEPERAGRLRRAGDVVERVAHEQRYPRSTDALQHPNSERVRYQDDRMHMNQRNRRDTRPDAEPVRHGLRDERFHRRQVTGRRGLGSHGPSTICHCPAPRRQSPTEANVQLNPRTQWIPGIARWPGRRSGGSVPKRSFLVDAGNRFRPTRARQRPNAGSTTTLRVRLRSPPTGG